MKELHHSHEFDTLPSERKPEGERKPAALLLQKLAKKAVASGINGWGTRADNALRERHRLWDKIRDHEPVRLCFETQPGAFIERELPETRDLLKDLTSEDAAILGDFDRRFLYDWEQGPRSGERYRFGVGENQLSEGQPTVSPVETPKYYRTRPPSKL